jgi:hypothetical protein
MRRGEGGEKRKSDEKLKSGYRKESGAIEV